MIVKRSDGGDRYKATEYNATGVAVRETYYVREPGGNIQAVYTKDVQTTGATPKLSEWPIVGLGRIGNIQVSYTTKLDPNDATKTIQQITYTPYYELSDHLGNVRVVFDRTAQTSGKPVVQYASDYYPFGETIASRTTYGYRYGYQGQFAEFDKGSTGLTSFYWRQYDSQIGRWKVTDPYEQFYSPYLGIGNNPVVGLDPDGGWTWIKGLGFFRNILGNIVYAFSGKRVTLTFSNISQRGTKTPIKAEFGPSSRVILNPMKIVNDIDIPISHGGRWPTYSGNLGMASNRIYEYEFSNNGTGDYKANFSGPNNRFLGENNAVVDGSLGKVNVEIYPDPSSKWNQLARQDDGENFGGNQNASFGFGSSAKIIQRSRLRNPIRIGIHHYGFLGLGRFYTINGTKVVGKRPK